MIILAKYFEYLGKTKKEIKEDLINYCNSQNRIKYDDGDEKTIIGVFIFSEYVNVVKNTLVVPVLNPKSTIFGLTEFPILSKYLKQVLYFTEYVFGIKVVNYQQFVYMKLLKHGKKSFTLILSNYVKFF